MEQKENKKRTKKEKANSWYDKFTFPNILILWIVIISIFGCIFYFFQNENNYLEYTRNGESVDRIEDSIYFSFVSATTTGFGDIVPHGIFKAVSVLEVIINLLMIAIVTSRLVSIKQSLILDELYEASFAEKMNRLRSGMLLFRQNISRVIERIEEKIIRKREISELYVHISSLEDSITGVQDLLLKSVKSQLVSTFDPVNVELMLTSVLNSIEKIDELVRTLNEENIEWRRDITLSLIGRCLRLAEDLIKNLDTTSNLSDKKIVALNEMSNEIITKIRKVI